MWSHTVLAAGIEDFEIEGISVGDSLLKYYSEKDIKKIIDKKQKYKDKSFVRGAICSKDNPQTFCKKVRGDFDTYDAIQFHFKKNDPEYKLFMISGIMDFIDDINACQTEKLKTTSELENLFPNADKKSEEKKHPSDKKKKSIVYTSYFYLNDGSASRVQCYDWSKKLGYPDHLKVTLDHPDYIDWMKNKAYK